MNTKTKKRIWQALLMFLIVSVCAWLGKQFLGALMLVISLAVLWELSEMVKKIDSFNKKLISYLLSVPPIMLSMLVYIYVYYVSDEFVAIVLVMVISVAAANSGAYMFGKLLGDSFGAKIFKNPRLTRISPNKTKIGAFFGVLSGALTFTALSSYLWLANVYILLLLGMAISVCSILGDIAQSVIKRNANKDDSGSLLGSHGGVYDRVDGDLFCSWAALVLVFFVI